MKPSTMLSVPLVGGVQQLTVAIVLLLFLFYFLLQNSALFLCKSVDPDQTPRIAASDLGLHFFAYVLFYGTLSIRLKLSL